VAERADEELLDPLAAATDGDGVVADPVLIAGAELGRDIAGHRRRQKRVPHEPIPVPGWQVALDAAEVLSWKALR
jgi:hypothetical protein